MLARLILLLAILAPIRWSFAFDFGMSLTPPSQQKTLLRYSGMLQPGSQPRASEDLKGVFDTNLTASVPVYRAENDGVSLSTRYNWLSIYPSSSSAQKLNLYDIQLGASYTHKIEERRFWSFSASFGSASDKPFQDSSVNTISATGMYSFPGSTSTGNWLVLVNYSNNRPILNNIPLPGFAYTYTPSKTFRGTFGAPFASIFWQFFEKWNLTVFTVAPWIAKAQVAYSIRMPIQVFSGIDFSQATYFQYGRANPDERLFFDEKKAFLGIRSPLSQFLFGELETGYSFGRQLFSAKTYTPSPSNPTQLGSSWYGRLSLTAAF